MHSERLKRFEINRQQLAEALTCDGMIIRFLGLPRDARCLGVFVDNRADSVVLVCEHPSFPIAADGFDTPTDTVLSNWTMAGGSMTISHLLDTTNAALELDQALCESTDDYSDVAEAAQTLHRILHVNPMTYRSPSIDTPEVPNA